MTTFSGPGGDGTCRRPKGKIGFEVYVWLGSPGGVQPVERDSLVQSHRYIYGSVLVGPGSRKRLLLPKGVALIYVQNGLFGKLGRPVSASWVVLSGQSPVLL